MIKKTSKWHHVYADKFFLPIPCSRPVLIRIKDDTDDDVPNIFAVKAKQDVKNPRNIVMEDYSGDEWTWEEIEAWCEIPL